MAFERLASGAITSTDPVSVYTVPTNATANVSRCVLTNTTANDINITVSVNDGTTRTLKALTIPAGVGKSVFVFEAYDSYSGGDIIVFEAASADTYNYIISGRQV